MIITDLKTVLLTAPSGTDPWLSQLRKVRSAAFIEIHTDTEHIGIGETYLGYHAPEIVPAMVEFFKPILVGLSDQQLDPDALWQRMYRCANFWARNGAGVVTLAGIESALWDLLGKLRDQPVWQLLGGTPHKRLPAYATGCSSNYPWSELHRKIDLYREAGFHGIKIGAGWHDGTRQFSSADPAAWAAMEVEKLEAIRQHTGPDFTVCMDGHMSSVAEGQTTWDVEMASTVLEAIAPYDVFFYEEPLHYNNRAGYAELCQRTSVSVAGGECLTTREEFADFAALDAFDIAQPDASFIGIRPFVDVANMFHHRGKRIAPHAWSAGAGVMANIHAAFVAPNTAIVELPVLPGPLHSEIYGPGYRFQDGYLLPPEGPGLGINLAEATKANYPFIPGSGEWNPVPGRSTIM